MLYVVLVGLTPACTRGCNTNGCNNGCVGGAGDPVSSCNGDRDCQAPEVCRRSYCRTSTFAAKEDFCRAHPSCKEAGHCGAELVRSFLGASNTLECVAVDVVDCKVSTNCAVHGRCSLETAFEHDRCIADTTTDCLASTNCALLEECVPVGGNCVRKFEGCTQTVDDFASDARFARDLEALGALGATDPGAVEDGFLGCVTTVHDSQTFVRIGASCTSAPYVGNRAFMRHVSLSPGDTLAVAVQDTAVSGQHDPLLKVTYTGSSPIGTDGPRPAITCHVITREVAATIGARVLAELDRALVTAKAQRLGADVFTYFPDRLPDLRAQIGHAAGWLGTQHPEIGKRAQQLDELEATRRGAVEAKLAAAAGAAVAAGTVVDAGDHLRVTTHGLVCGDALRARYAAIGTERTVAPHTCALEVAVDNRGSERVSIGWLGFGRLRAAWLRPHARPGTEAYESATVIDARGSEQNAVPSAELQLEPGKLAIVLVTNQRADLELGVGQLDAAAILRFAAWSSAPALLHTNL